MQTGKIWHLAVVLMMALALFLPTAVFALDGNPYRGEVAQMVYQHGGDEEAADEGAAEDGSAEGVGFVLTLIMGIIALIIAVVAVAGAVGLGVIGIGYASVSNSEE